MIERTYLNQEFYRAFFARQTVFLTGATGGLGGCLLYKLVTQIHTKKVFLLHRASKETTIAKLRNNLSTYIDSILESDRVTFIRGDLQVPGLDLSEQDLAMLQQETTLVINSAADTSFKIDACESFQNNCLPALEFAKIASSFPKLIKFVQVSTVYANSFLPDGNIAEQIHLFGATDLDCEKELEQVFSERSTPRTGDWLWPYAQAKYVMERLLVQRYPELPLLIIRPSSIGPAIKDPFPHFGPDGSNPVETFAILYLATNGGTKIWHSAKDSNSGTWILDEMPVDLVSNTCLLHISQGSQGIVHAAAELYISKTADQLFASAIPHIPRDMRWEKPYFQWVTDRRVPPCTMASIFGLRGQSWVFECGRSRGFKDVDGPLSLNIDGHDDQDYIRERVTRIIPTARVLKEKFASKKRGQVNL
ncbi:uncharacterized protein N7529_003083 [Penicillium soppii]|uniref:uncharacterized protein n=1 Tax=Penicillium soppii TaxID=69789 RepID=UPI0025493AD1|nr:uncharacterized protein N7529_003083 [Penicillium soppii]KAJ5874653.1 hypothetical protein N7529_003083 [Penicillium soppii]